MHINFAILWRDIMNKRIKKLAALVTGTVTAFSAASGYAPAKKSSAPAANAADTQVVAFPGAVGGGKYATGGRGGEVYHVTNLNDSGAGSFRDAVSKSNRIVVFDVSGTIELKGNVTVASNVTIAGQTAPGGSGITLKNYKLGMAGDNIICRYISSRPGPYASTSSGNDAWGGAKGSNSMIDHCSMGWTTDEQWGLYSYNEYYTVQYSVIGPADSWGGHKKGLHGFGMMMGNGNLSFDHNLIIHNVSRNFRGKVPEQKTADFTNNVIYDWGYQTAYGTIGHLNYVNNTLKMGNSTTGGKHYVYVDSTTKPENFKIYIGGNRILNKDGSVYGGPTYDNWSGVDVKNGIGITKNDLVSQTPFRTIVNGENVSSVGTAESAEASYEHVVNFAGNGIAPDKRTAIDRQCAYETISGTGSCSGTSAYDASVTDLDKYSIRCGVTYDYPAPVLQKIIVDADNDGMADDWELARGLDPTDPYDVNGDYCGQGYTNIEYYINDLTVDSFPEGVVKLSPESSVPPVPSVSAFETIEAESFAAQEGLQIEKNEDGSGNIGYIENGDHAMYRKVAFGDGAKSVKLRISGNASKIELYLDSLSKAPAAVVDFPGTSGFTDYTDAEFNIPAITGTHDLYLKFTGGEGYLVNVDSFVFSRDALPINGRYIMDLKVIDAERAELWSILPEVKADSRIYGDRDFTYAQPPSELIGGEALLTACDSKYAETDLASFTAGCDMDVYVGYDDRVDPLPQWIADWEKTAITAASDNGVNFVFYKKSFKKGDSVLLGQNGQSAYCMNYNVIVKPSSPGSVSGDVNLDGELGIADLVALQKYILGTGMLDAEAAKAADVCADGRIDIFDAVKLRKMLVYADLT